MWTHAGPDTFPNGCMIAEVEVDPETGVVKIDRVCSVDDACVAINPLTLDGQLHGSLAQAVGEMLMESVIYERGTGQLLKTTILNDSGRYLRGGTDNNDLRSVSRADSANVCSTLSGRPNLFLTRSSRECGPIELAAGRVPGVGACGRAPE
jgi:Molybdopterin-binding domain of aldehyde dehydrogenase